MGSPTTFWGNVWRVATKRKFGLVGLIVISREVPVRHEEMGGAIKCIVWGWSRLQLIPKPTSLATTRILTLVPFTTCVIHISTTEDNFFFSLFSEIDIVPSSVSIKKTRASPFLVGALGPEKLYQVTWRCQSPVFVESKSRQNCLLLLLAGHLYTIYIGCPKMIVYVWKLLPWMWKYMGLLYLQNLEWIGLVRMCCHPAFWSALNQNWSLDSRWQKSRIF